MKIFAARFLLYTAVLHASIVLASESINDRTLPANTITFCQQHVSGAPTPDGRPGPHIIWHAHSSDEVPESVVAYYAAQFQRPAGMAHDGGAEWRVGPEHSQIIYSIYPAAVKDHVWRDCEQPAGAKTVILISHFISERS